MPPLRLPPRPPQGRKPTRHIRRNAVHYQLPKNIVTVDKKTIPIMPVERLFTIPEDHACDSSGLELLATVSVEVDMLSQELCKFLGEDILKTKQLN